jgi:hypothetical protein
MANINKKKIKKNLIIVLIYHGRRDGRFSWLATNNKFTRGAHKLNLAMSRGSAVPPPIY